jgi:hypothetical protein
VTGVTVNPLPSRHVTCWLPLCMPTGLLEQYLLRNIIKRTGSQKRSKSQPSQDSGPDTYDAEMVLCETILKVLASERVTVHRSHFPIAASHPHPTTHVRCVSIFLDKNRRYIGTSQSKRPPKRTQRTPHLSSDGELQPCWIQVRLSLLVSGSSGLQLLAPSLCAVAASTLSSSSITPTSSSRPMPTGFWPPGCHHRNVSVAVDLPGRFRPQFRVKNRHDIGKSQSI